MRIKKPLILIFFLTLSLRAFSTVFTVTSNADSGPGTLRDALTQAAANGTATIDYIYFNLPGNSLVDRTITLRSNLPNISSNLVIDGTTQPGNAFGVTNTKIRIDNEFAYPANISTFYANGVDGVEIYGMWLTGTNINYGVHALWVRNFGSIKIGAPGKGNLVEYGNIGLDTGKVVLFQSNICYSDTLGERPGQGGISILSCDNVTLGGSEAAGNMMAAAIELFFSNPISNTLELSFNLMGTDITGTKAPYGFNIMTTRVNIESPINNLGQYTYTPLYGNIHNNIFADVYDAILLRVQGMGGKIVIQGNGFNTDSTGTLNFNTYSQSTAFYGITAAYNKDVLIGGDDPSQKNLIAYCSEGIGYYNDQNFTDEKCTISRNSIFCVGDISFIGYVGVDKLPQSKITTFTQGSISGTATPGSTVELFNADCSCYGVNTPKYYFATVLADNNGNWSYNGASSANVMVSATLDSLTGYFTGMTVDDSNLRITSTNCGKTGSITGIQTPYVTGIEWYNSQNQIVGTNTDLINVPPGTYTIKIAGGACGLSKTYQITDQSIHIDTSQLIYVKPSCQKSGSITGMAVSGGQTEQLTYQWTDAAGNTICSCLNLTNAAPGSYFFIASNSDGSCAQNYGPFTLKNVTGPNIDQSNAAIQSTNCGQSTGSITGITATGSGTLKYIWWNGQQQTVSTTADLLNQPAGTYKLEVTDDSQCGPVYTSELTIPQTNGITMDESAAQTTVASCNINNGSVTGITITGATQYQWTDSNGKIVGSAPDLQGVAAGTYTLTASNSFGCTAISKPYTVAPLPPTKFPVYTNNIVSACYQSADGAITVNTDVLVQSARWVNAQSQTVGTGSSLQNIPAGDYQLYLTDQNGCENYYNTYTVTQFAQLAATDNGTVANDQCTLSVGNISGENITGGAPPYTYAWYDSNNQQIGSGVSISNLLAGNYSLKVSDTRCGSLTINYQVTDQAEDVPQPSVSNVALCTSGNAAISVNNPSASTVYRLYANGTDTQPIAEQKGGFFTVKVTGNTSFYVSQLNVSCESSRAQVMVTVGLSAINIANTFTPNGDGINDLWQINGIASYPQSEVEVFTRWGQRVFYSKGYAIPFDGTFDGKPLPDGVYYYIVNLNTNCSLLSGSLTIIR